MRCRDYVKLGTAEIFRHKKRAFVVSMITGIIFSFMTTGIFVLQGIENTVLSKMYVATNGNTFILSAVDIDKCGKRCDLSYEVLKIKQNIAKNNGEIVDGKMINKNGIFFIHSNKNLLPKEELPNNIPSDVNIVAVTVPTAAILADIKAPSSGDSVEEKNNFIDEVYKKTLRQTITRNGDKYYILKLLPSKVYNADLSFNGIGKNSHPLNLVLAKLQIGETQNIIISTSDKLSSGEFQKLEDAGIVMSAFPTLTSAKNYYRLEENYCNSEHKMLGNCPVKNKYKISSIVGSPISIYDTFQNIWNVAKNICIALFVIATIISTSTNVRIIGNNKKIIFLYYVAGATKWQIRMVFFLYLFSLSVISMIISIGIGLANSALVSIINRTDLIYVFKLGLGATGESIWLIGWNYAINVVLFSILFATILSIIVCNEKFSRVKSLKNI